MHKLRHLQVMACGVMALLFIVAIPAHGFAPQAAIGTYLEIETESAGGTQSIKLFLGPDRMRLDAAEGVSLITLGGEDGKMLMVQHDEKRYLEFSAAMMEQMAAMMGQMPTPAEVQEDVDNAVQPTFTRTGNTKQVGEWNAYEVLVEHPDQDGDTTMWFSQDVDADFRALAEQVIDSMSSLLNNPMMARMTSGAGAGGGNLLSSIQAQIAATNMPDGFPVQIVSNAGGGTNTNTLRAIDQARSFDAATFEVPAGYQKMDLPFGRR